MPDTGCGCHDPAVFGHCACRDGTDARDERSRRGCDACGCGWWQPAAAMDRRLDEALARLRLHAAMEGTRP